MTNATVCFAVNRALLAYAGPYTKSIAVVSVSPCVTFLSQAYVGQNRKRSVCHMRMRLDCAWLQLAIT